MQGRAPPPAAAPDTLTAVLRAYFDQRDSILSPDGLLRIGAVVTCIACAGLQLGGAWCGRGALAAGVAGTTLSAAFLLTALSALAACALPRRAPLAWLCVELVVSTAVGGVLLVSASLVFGMCDAHTRLDHLHAPFALLSGVLALLSAVCMYTAVSRHWDRAQAAAAAAASAAAAPPPATEQDA